MRLKATGVQCSGMPETFFRLLAVLLLALTIPLQGMAAVTAGQCMALAHHQDGGGHDNHGQAPDGANSDDHAAPSHSGDGTKQGDEGAKSSHCGPCTACCASASIAGPAALSILSSPSNAKHSFAQQPPPGIQPDGLDRPPLAL